jgi:spermidine/putrescine transport system substrate-binding protein
MSFMMQPENAAIVSAFSDYPNAVEGSDAFLDPKLAKAPEFNPPESLQITFIPDCPAQAIKAYDRIWTKLRQ